MNKLWMNNLREIEPYTPGEQPKIKNITKLNTNENPYPPSPKVKEALNELDFDRFRLYPDPNASDLVSVLADYYKLNNDQVFVGNGSDEVLALCFLTYFNSEKEILFPDITYSFYPVYGNLFKIKYRQVPLNNNLEIIKEDYFSPNGGIIFPNPNAPTGICVGLDFIEDILKKNSDSVVIIDEAYIDFGGVSAIPLIEKYDNLVIIQTYSKSRSLAGLRVGVALGSKEAIAALNAVKNSFNSYPLDYVAQRLATASIKDEEYFNDTLSKIIKTRENTVETLKSLGFIIPESKANFIFATHPRIKAKDLFEALKKDGIFVRYFSAPKIDNYLRITIGTDDEMFKLISFIKDNYPEETLC
ncbi:MAG: histidinol-phosphate transaminase [Clostridiaceae bacterium]